MNMRERFQQGGGLPSAKDLKTITGQVLKEKEEVDAEGEFQIYSKYIARAVESGHYECEICFEGFGCTATYNVLTIKKLQSMGYVTSSEVRDIEGPCGDSPSKVLTINWG